MAGTIHIVGAGVAGLSAALAATRAGRAAIVYEAAPQVGGRCRTIHPAAGFSYDNGTHVLFTGNRAATGFLERIGARGGWIEPEPEGCPVYDAASGRVARVGLSPWSWLTPGLRPEGFSGRDVLRLLRLALPLPDRPVARLMADSAVLRSLVEPMTVAVLNTPAGAASSRRLGVALRRLARPGAARLLVARTGLGEDLVDPALRAVSAAGVTVETGRRLRSLLRSGSRVTALAFAGRTVALKPEDRVVLALPPYEVARLLPGVPVPEAFEPILNAHFPFDGPERARFVGLVGTLAQWALLRRDHVSVTVSAASAAIDEDAELLSILLWREIAPALRALGFAADAAAPPPAHIVKERRATIRQAAGRRPRPPLRPLENLALAGDWIGALPATIESAVLSGERAVRAVAGRANPRTPLGFLRLGRGGAASAAAVAKASRVRPR